MRTTSRSVHPLALSLGRAAASLLCPVLVACIGQRLPPPPPAAYPAVAAAAPGEPPTLPVANAGAPVVAQVAADEAPPSTPLDGATPTVLAAPPFGYALTRPAPAGTSAPPRLVKASEQRNAITDEQAWFERNRLSLPTFGPRGSAGRAPGEPPPFVPPRYRENLLVQGIAHGEHLVLIYGPDFGSGRFVAVLDQKHELVALLDFDRFLTPPEIAPGEAAFVRGQVTWAVVEHGVLYVSTGHRTYAASSRGKNAFLSAIDLGTGQLLWQSAPLVCNAQSFIVHGDHLICGYGFTAEPDFLYVLERATGKTVSKLPLKSGPDYLIEKDSALFVRTYDTDYVFSIR